MNSIRKMQGSKKKKNIRKKLLYSEEQLHAALRALNKGEKILCVSKKFNVPESTLRDKLSGKSQPKRQNSGFKSYLGEEIENELVAWLMQCANMGFAITKKLLIKAVQKIVTGRGIKTPFKDDIPSKNWFYKFMRRHKELSQKRAEHISRARGLITEASIRKWFNEVYELLGDDAQYLNDPSRVFNLDETGFELAPKTGKVIGIRGRNVYEECNNSDKENLTTLFCVNANGQFAPSLTLYKYARMPKTIAAAPPGWGLGKSDSGWMTAECFYEYFTNVLVPYLKSINTQLPIYMFMDGHRSHLSKELSMYCSSERIHLISLFPNATHILQPLDVSVFGPMKKKWQNICRQFKLDNDFNEICKENVPMLLNNFVMDPSMKKNIINGFRSTGIFPFNANNVDYKKVIQRVKLNSTIDNNETNLLSHNNVGNLFEDNVAPEVLLQFEKTGNKEWGGKTDFRELFNFWKKLKFNDRSKQTINLIEANNNVLNNEIDKESYLDISSTQNEIVSSNVSEFGKSVIIDEPGESKSAAEPPDSNKQIIKDINLLHDFLLWPKQPITKKRLKQVERLPSVVTSAKWLEIQITRENAKEEEDIKKIERKNKAAEKKELKEKEKQEKTKRKQAVTK
ncbi:jerky protein homolog-like [Hydra vulgaris]|uniref:Jerky protein homolog-like n=1 Tax=Hydra vulgaris TaxID=6087 RepID=A0ABM4DBJ0_HYDVU